MSDRTNYDAAIAALDAAHKKLREPNMDRQDPQGAQAIATIAVARAVLALVDELKGTSGGSGEPMVAFGPRR